MPISSELIAQLQRLVLTFVANKCQLQAAGRLRVFESQLVSCLSSLANTRLLAYRLRLAVGFSTGSVAFFRTEPIHSWFLFSRTSFSLMLRRSRSWWPMVSWPSDSHSCLGFWYVLRAFAASSTCSPYCSRPITH